ncbi:MAG: type II toxin-antitoxin system VapC family toxin [Chloroflexi bacterium]|nr:type II toxin-antitoxin system VapC family toxin [Chloroflexota bacterium]
MDAVFLDSSALVKLVVVEPETDALIAFLGEPRVRVLISEIAVTEVTRAARRVGADPAPALAECEVILLRSAQLATAATLEPLGLRTLDAIHLAAAQEVAAHLDGFVAYDRRLLDAAHALGLRVAAPGMDERP